MQEKEYLFNPFNIKNKTSKELKEMYSNVFQQLLEEPNTMYEYAHNLEVYSNLNYIIGEVIARLTAESTKWESKFYDEAKKVDRAIKYMEDNSKISIDDYVSIIKFYKELLSMLKGVDKE